MHDREEAENAPAAQGPPGAFPVTRWSLVIAAREGVRDPASQEAVAELCAIYWRPLYTYARRLGNPPADAEDLTQGFLARLIEKHRFGHAEQQLGRMRSYLLTAFKNYIRNEWQKERAAKRGGASSFVAIDLDRTDRRIEIELADPSLTPDEAYDRLWVLTLLDRVVDALRDEYERLGKALLFEQVSGFLVDHHGRRPYGAAAAALGMTENGVKVAVSRMRKRYRELLIQAVRDTVARQEDFDEELAHLMSTFQR